MAEDIGHSAAQGGVSIPGQTEAAYAPACRACGARKWVAAYWPDRPKETVCMACCATADHEDGESGHQWSLVGEGCDYCGISRSDAGPDYDWSDA